MINYSEPIHIHYYMMGVTRSDSDMFINFMQLLDLQTSEYKSTPSKVNCGVFNIYYEMINGEAAI